MPGLIGEVQPKGEMMMGKLVSAKEACERLCVSERTLRRWDRTGKIKAFRPTPTSHRRHDVEDFLARNSNIEEPDKTEPRG
jgi:excisionase family DNA binding protein